jgi:hypothetical protein
MRYFLMRFVRPALYIPVEMFRFFPGSIADESGLKRKILGLVVRLDKPLIALNRRWYAEETNR